MPCRKCPRQRVKIRRVDTFARMFRLNMATRRITALPKMDKRVMAAMNTT